MSKAVRIGDASDQLRQWITDDKPCDTLGLPNGFSTLTIEVKGDLAARASTSTAV